MADVTIEVLPDILTVSTFELGMGLVDQELIWGDAEAKRRAMRRIGGGFVRTNTHMMGFGLRTLQKNLGDPVDVSHLAEQFDRMDQIGLPKMMTIYNVPSQYKVVVERDGTQRTLKNPEEHFSDKGRPAPDLFDELLDLIRHPVRLALERGVRSFYVWNEAKGFFYSDTPHAWAVDDYVRLYNALVDVILDTAGAAGVPGSEIRIGGPYVPVRVQTVTNANSLPAEHPLNGPWGGVKQEAIRFLERFVTQAKRLDMLVIDMGLGLTEGESWVDEFENCTRIPVIINYVRDVARAAGWDVPVELAELYLEPQDPANTNRQLRAALAAEALRCLVEAGVGAAFVWGFRHGGQSAILTATDTPEGGAPMPVWEVCRIFSESFCRGQRIHRLAIQGKGAGAIANDRDVLLINHTRGPLTVELCGAVHELTAYERRLVPCAAV